VTTIGFGGLLHPFDNMREGGATARLIGKTVGAAKSSYHEYAGRSAEEQNERCGLIVDRVRMPSDPRARI
jgi:hypothetical protein